MLKILEGYGVGPRVRALLKSYWDNQRCVARSGWSHGTAFRPTRGATQGGILSPSLFNIVVDTVVRKWYADVMADIISANTGLEGEAVGRISTLFYVDDGLVGSLDPNWLQDAI